MDPQKLHLQEQIIALQRELEARDENVFDLSATLATVEAERISMEQQNASQIGLLQEQLRRAQQEANLARAQQKLQNHNVGVASPEHWIGAETNVNVVQPPTLASQSHQQPQWTPPLPSIRHHHAHCFQISTAHRLAQLLLSSINNSPYGHENAFSSILLTTLSQIAVSSQDDQTTITELDISWWLILKFCSLLNTDTVVNMLEDGVDKKREKGLEAKQPEQDRRLQSLQILLHLLLDAFTFSPTTCNFLNKAINDPSKSATRQRTSCLRIINSKQQPYAQQRLESFDLQLQSPFWNPTINASGTSTESTLPTILQQRNIRRFFQCCHNLALLQEDAMSLELAILALRLLKHMYTTNCDEIHVTKVNFTDSLLSTWTSVVAFLLHKVCETKNSLISSTISRSSRQADCTTSSITLRLLHPFTSNKNDSITKESSPKDLKSRLCRLVNESELDIFNWLAESMSLLRVLWKPEHWLSTGRAGSLLAACADLLERIVIPDVSLHAHPMSIECVLWLQTMAAVKSGSTSPTTTTMQKMCNRLLRTQQSTTRSTAELWHFAPSVIAVAIQLFHTVVIRQHLEDHLMPPSRAALQAIALSRVRDHLVRFFHAVVQAVQEDRHQWEREHQIEPKTDTINNREFASFLTVISECQELYTSAATLLLATPDKEHNLYPIHSDILAMLRIQMDELAEDQMEKLSVE